jgi:hypothetical protein
VVSVYLIICYQTVVGGKSVSKKFSYSWQYRIAFCSYGLKLLGSLRFVVTPLSFRGPAFKVPLQPQIFSALLLSWITEKISRFGFSVVLHLSSLITPLTLASQVQQPARSKQVRPYLFSPGKCSIRVAPTSLSIQVNQVCAPQRQRTGGSVL